MVDLTAAEVFRDFVSDGIPSSGEHDPNKPDIRRLLGQYEQIIRAFTSNGGLIYSSLAALNADLSKPANSMAWVMGDPIAANNGVYGKVGAAGAGSWTRRADLPFPLIVAEDSGEGTPNAIQATSSLPISGSSLVTLTVYENNTASPVTVSFNGGEPLVMKTNSGNDVPPAGLPSIVLGRVSGTTFRLVSDVISSAVVAAAEAAQAAAEAAASSIVERSFVSVAQAMAANISPLAKRIQTQFFSPLWADLTTLVGDAPYRRVSFAELAGYPSAAFFRSQDRYMLDGTVDPVNGGYWVNDDLRPDPFQFGARVGPVDGSFTYNSGPALEAWVYFVNKVTRYGEILPGGYRNDRTLYVDGGVQIDALGSLANWEIPYFAINSVAVEEGVSLIMTGNGPKNETLDYCSSMEYAGLFRTNPQRTHNNANDAVFSARDFTMSDAVGVTKASLRSFSAAIVVGKDGESAKSRLGSIRVVPACADGINGDLAGYLNATVGAYVPWAQWDVGIYVMNGFTTHVHDCQAAGYWGICGVLQSSIRFGNTTGGGRGEMCIWERNFIQCGVAVRSGDFYPIIAKTANSLTIPFNKGHRFNPTGTLFTDQGNFAYTAVSYSATGEGSLTFTVSASTADIVVGGFESSFVFTTNNNGTTQTVFRDNNIRDFWHISDAEYPSVSFGAQARPYKATIEMVGYPGRGITWENNTIYDKNPFSILIQGMRDIKFATSGTWEEKPYKATIGGASNPSGSQQGLVICGPDAAHANALNVLLRGAVDVEGYPWSGRLNLSGTALITGAVGGVRYSGYGDWFNPFRFTWSNRPSGDPDIVYDVRQPERRIISNGSVSIYAGRFKIDTEASASIDDLTNAVPYVIGLNEIVFQTFNSSRDVVIKHMAAGDYNFYCKSGADTTLFSPITPVMFFLDGKTWYQA